MVCWYYLLINEVSKESLPNLLRLWGLKPNYIISFPTSIYLLKVNDRNTRTRYEIRSKLIRKRPEGHQWPRSGAFIVNFEHIAHLSLVSSISIVNFERVNVGWDIKSGTFFWCFLLLPVIFFTFLPFEWIVLLSNEIICNSQLQLNMCHTKSLPASYRMA